MNFKLLAASLMPGLLYACASDGGNLQRESAISIGKNVRPEQVQISNIDRGMTSVKWRAVAPAGTYDCSADDMVRRVLCVKR